MPHRGQQRPDPDPVAGRGGRPLALAEAVQHRLDDLVEGQAPLDVQLGGEADLGVDDAVGGQVLGALGGHPAQRRRAVCMTPTVCAKVSR